MRRERFEKGASDSADLGILPTAVTSSGLLALLLVLVATGTQGDAGHVIHLPLKEVREKKTSGGCRRILNPKSETQNQAKD